jgi:hypothetical protein
MFRSLNIPGNLYDKLMFFIKNNKKIPAFLENEIPNNVAHLENIKVLKNALISGDTNCPIFFVVNSHTGERKPSTHCLPYLCYLARALRDQQTGETTLKGVEKLEGLGNLNENQILTALIYVMTLMSAPYDAKIININTDESFNKKEYIEKMIKKTKDSFGLELNEEILSKELSVLTGADAWLISRKLPEVMSKAELYYIKLFNFGAGPLSDIENEDSRNFILEDTKEYCKTSPDEEHKTPSVAVMNLILRQVNPTPVKFFPIFGRINTETLKAMHAQGFHPLPLHGGEFVTMNLEFIHDVEVKTQAKIALDHDVYHTFSGSLLNSNQHRYLYKTFVPRLERVIAIIEADKKNAHGEELEKRYTGFIEDLKTIVNSLIDMDTGLLIRGKKLIAASPNFFKEWIKFNFEDRKHVQVKDYAQYAVRLYCELLNSLSAEEKKLTLELIEVIHFKLNTVSLVSLKENLAWFMSTYSDNLPVKFDIESFEETYKSNINNEAMVKRSLYLQSLKMLLTTCDTGEEFTKALYNSHDHSSLYDDFLIKGLYYVPGVIDITDEDLQEMKKIANIKPANNLNIK